MVIIITQYYQINNKSWFLYWYLKFWLNFSPKFRKILLSRWSIKDFIANLNLTKGLSPSDVLPWQQCSLRKILNDLAKVNFKTWQELSNASPFLLRWKFGKSWKKLTKAISFYILRKMKANIYRSSHKVQNQFFMPGYQSFCSEEKKNFWSIKNLRT